MWDSRDISAGNFLTFYKVRTYSSLSCEMGADPLWFLNPFESQLYSTFYVIFWVLWLLRDVAKTPPMHVSKKKKSIVFPGHEGVT